MQLTGHPNSSHF